MPMAPATALASLKNNPAAFLKVYPIRIFGGTRASGVRPFAIENRGDSMRPGSILGTKNFHQTESFNIRLLNSNMAGPGAHTFNAHSVRMDVGESAMTTYQLDNTGPDIMVTGQLSGCSFIISSNGNNTDVAHVKPSGSTGAELATALSTSNPNSFVYGATAGHGFYDSDDRTVSVIGIRQNGNWEIYAQKQDANSGDYRIHSVYQIYPNHVKM